MPRSSVLPSCFLSEHVGFCGVIKKNIADFVVTELDCSGEPVTRDAPAPVGDAAAAGGEQDWLDRTPDPVETGSLDLSLVLGRSVSEQLEQFVVMLREEQLQQKELSLGSFADKQHRAVVHRAVRHRFPFLMTVTVQPEIRVREDPDYKALARLVSEAEAEDFFRFIDSKVQDSSYSFHHDGCRQHRTEVHRFLNRRFGKLVETKSLSDTHQTFICARLRERGRARKRSSDDRRAAEVYTGFTLQKQNLETLEAVGHMATTLGVLPSDFTYAGIKDKRAVTFQAMVVKKVSPQRLQERRGELERRGIFLSQVRSVSEPLRLGQLAGNHFDLVVRDLKPHCDSAHAPLAGLVDRAVENVKNRGFVNYFGPQRFGTTRGVQSDQVGLALLQNDVVGALQLFFSPEEGSDATSEAKRFYLQTGDAKETLALMPLSKVRERLMLKALNRYGTGPDGCTQAWLSLPHSSRVFYPHAYCSRVWNEAASQRLLTLGHRARQGDLVWTGTSAHQGSGPAESGLVTDPQVHVVTGQEEEDGVYTLAHVLLPMPGNTVKYPGNLMAAWYRDRLARDRLENCNFRISCLRMNLPGCYRPLLAHLSNLRYTLQSEVQDGPGAPAEDGRDGPALVLNFDLDSSCYATVGLREMMKCDL